MTLGQLPIDVHELRGGDPQPALLEAVDDASGESALDGIRLDQDERLLRHSVFLRGRISVGSVQ